MQKFKNTTFQKIVVSFCFAFFTFALEKAEAVLIPVGTGGYTTELPAGQKGPSDKLGNPVFPAVTSHLQQPPITHDWWTSLIWKYNTTNPWSEHLYAYPFSCQAFAEGLGLCYITTPTISPYVLTSSGYQSHEYHYKYAQDLLVGVAGLSSSDTKVDNYSDWTVNAFWSGNNRTLNATIGKGLPFLYFTISGDNVLLTPKKKPVVWYNNNGVLGVTINGHHYGIFAPSGSTWIIGSTLSSSLSGKNYLSIAALPDNTLATLEFYRKHAYAFVTKTTVSWNYKQAQAQLVTVFNAETTLKEEGNGNVNRPLLALFPHQWLNTNSTLSPYIYVSPKGNMKVIDASSFSTNLTFNGILPELPNVAVDGVDTYDAAQLYQYVNDIYVQDPLTRFKKIKVGDTYWTGKAMGRLARLVQIADQVGHTAARDLFLSDLKGRLQEWFSGQGSQLFYYDRNWQTLIGYPASYGSDTELNDHHFHYGYFIMAAATIAQYDPDWATEAKWGGMVNLLIKDVNNWDRTDNRFPFLRVFDAYQGNGWANGPALFGSGNNQESSSESMNFSTAVILWGATTNNQAIRDLGIYLYATETSAIEQYWFDIDQQVFPADWKEPTIGVNWSNGGAYAIWWNGRIEELHGINFTPITGGSLYLGRNPAYLKINETFMQDNGGTTTDWIDIHMAVRAFYDPIGQIALFNSNSNYKPEAGETQAHTYHWIHNLNVLGTLNTAITADQPTYAVFDKDGTRTYVAFNPYAFPIIVNFSDGYQLSAAANQLASSKETALLSFLQGANDLDGGQVSFWFQSTPISDSVTLNYQINGRTQQSIAMTQTVANWQTVISGINTGDKITYSFAYTINSVPQTTSSFQHIYTIDHGFTQSAVDAPNGLCNFTFQSNQVSSSVNINYEINSDTLQTSPMMQGINDWEYQIDNLNYGDVISYSFDYVQNQNTYTSPTYKKTYSISSPTHSFSQYVAPYAWGSAGIMFTPADATDSVIVHYTINNGGRHNVTMNNSNGTWSSIVIGLIEGDIITYNFTYSQNQLKTESASFQYTYHPSATSPPPNGPYTQQINPLTNGNISFTFVPNTAADWVILHYTLKGGNKHNVNMTKVGDNWTYAVSGLSSGTIIDYSYTCSINGSSFNTVAYEFVYYVP